MAVRLRVTYLDDREEVVLVSPRAQVMAERHFAGTPDAKRIEQSYFLAWASLNRAGKESAEFEPFLDLIADVDEIEDEPVDPTPEAPTSDTSSP